MQATTIFSLLSKTSTRHHSPLLGSFVWIVMPFGLYNAPTTFQRLAMYIFTALLFKSMTVSVHDLSTQSNASDHLYLAMVFSVKKFCHYLICNPIVIFKDHMAIKYLVNKAELNKRLARWILLLKEFDYTVEYKPGRMHLQVDHLSRLSKVIGISPLNDGPIDDYNFVLTAQLEWLHAL